VFNGQNHLEYSQFILLVKFKVKFKLPSTYRGRPIGLVAIVSYKLIITILFAFTSVAILFALKNYPDLQEFAANYRLEGKHRIINWMLEKLFNLNPKKLQFSGFAAAGYSLVSGIEAIGLWREKAWAHVLVLALVGVSIPLEIYEIFRGVTIVKLMVFGLNVLVFSYLLTHLPKRHAPQPHARRRS
jgi:uncharacterized membrane protein (DUF2068 family)